MRTRMIYEGKSDDNRYSTFIFVINGKGDWGNGSPWTDEEYDVAVDLAKYIYNNTCSPEPIYEGDTVWFCNDDDWGIMDWRMDVEEAYRNWKEQQR